MANATHRRRGLHRRHTALQQRHRLLQGERVGADLVGHRGVAPPVGDEGAVAPGLEPHRRAVGGMGPELAQGPLGLLFGVQP